MSETKKSKKIKKHIIDVQAPGTSAPSLTSKPVIVTNRALLRDPMMADDTQATDEDEPKPAADQPADMLTPSHEAVVKPLNDSAAGDDSAPDDEGRPPEESQSKEEPAGSAVPVETSSATEDDTSTPKENEPADTASDEPAGFAGSEPGPGDNPKPPAAPAAKQAEAEAAAQARHEAEIQQLVDSRQYELPIRTAEQRKSKRFVLLGAALAVILIVIWLDIALDAGIIKLGGLRAPTHFFSN
jgi:hypothetical protein